MQVQVQGERAVQRAILSWMQMAPVAKGMQMLMPVHEAMAMLLPLLVSSLPLKAGMQAPQALALALLPVDAAARRRGGLQLGPFTLCLTATMLAEAQGREIQDTDKFLRIV